MDASGQKVKDTLINKMLANKVTLPSFSEVQEETSIFRSCDKHNRV